MDQATQQQESANAAPSQAANAGGASQMTASQGQKVSPADRPGWQTTEFWSHACVIVCAVAGALTGVLPGQAAIIAAGIASGAYAISRALTKVGGAL